MYILIDFFPNPSYPQILTIEGSDEAEFFSTLEEAQEALEKYCQNGLIVDITEKWK